jgi:hypothetical protein
VLHGRGIISLGHAHNPADLKGSLEFEIE